MTDVADPERTTMADPAEAPASGVEPPSGDPAAGSDRSVRRFRLLAAHAGSDPSRSGPDPRRPDRGDDVAVAGVPHDRECRQRAVADGRDRGAGHRPAARHPHPRHRPVGRFDAGACVGRRRDGVLTRRLGLVGDRHHARRPAPRSASSTGGSTCGAGCPTRSSSRWRRSASPAASRCGCPVVSHSGACRPIVRTIGNASCRLGAVLGVPRRRHRCSSRR